MSGSSKLSSGRAIITFSRGWQSLAATRSLGRRGIEVVTGDEYAMTPASFSRYTIADFRYPSPTHEPEKFLEVLEETVVRHKPKDEDTPYVLMPIHKETYLIAQNRHRFEPHIRLRVPEFAQIQQVHNKGTLAAHAMKLGLPIPRTWLIQSIQDLQQKLPEISLPAFVKLRESAAGVGVQKVDSAEELQNTFHSFLEKYGVAEGEYPIVQEAIDGEDYCVTTLFDRGKLIACMSYHNLRQFPPQKGAGVLRETVEVPQMEKIVSNLLGPMKWDGVAEIDFRWTGEPNATPSLIEVNPRFWGGLIQAIESGWDYPWLLFQLAAHGRVESVEEGRFDVRTETPVLGLLATLQEIAENDNRMDAFRVAWTQAQQEFEEGSKRVGMRQWLSGLKELIDVKGRASEVNRMLEVHKDNVYDVLSLSDPKPAFGVLYPLAVFLKHGKVNMELLTSEGGPAKKKPEESA